MKPDLISSSLHLVTSTCFAWAILITSRQVRRQQALIEGLRVKARILEAAVALNRQTPSGGRP